jgi:hypothetical protein
MYIVIQGDPLEGFTFTGPFTSRDEADKWMDAITEPCWLATLSAPKFD